MGRRRCISRARARSIDLLLAAGADIDARDVDHRSTAAEWMLDQQTRRGAIRPGALSRRARRIGGHLSRGGARTHRSSARDARARVPNCSSCERDGASTASSRRAAITSTSGRSATSRSPLDVAAQFEQHETLQAMLAFASPLQRLHARLPDAGTKRRRERCCASIPGSSSR